MMDFFGRIVDDLSDIWSDIYESPYAEEAKPVLRAIDKAIEVAATIERERLKLSKAASPSQLEEVAEITASVDCDATPQPKATLRRAPRAKPAASKYAAE